MIYTDEFIETIKKDLSPIKIKTNNIICRCPWCEYGKDKSHYHFYISTEKPIFHCFHAGCEKSGTIRKLLRKLKGFDEDPSEKYYDKDKLVNDITQPDQIIKNTENRFKLVELDTKRFAKKLFYLKQRFKFTEFDLNIINNLIFDINGFFELNNLQMPVKFVRFKHLFDTQYVGFLSVNHSILFMRNISNKGRIKHIKIPLKSNMMMDYYKIENYDIKNNNVVIAEGVFDIFGEYFFNFTKTGPHRVFAAALSSNFNMLIKSIVFNEQIFKLNLTILSDDNINEKKYKNLFYYNKHIIKNIKVFYNSCGKDFGKTYVEPVKIFI